MSQGLSLLWVVAAGLSLLQPHTTADFPNSAEVRTMAAFFCGLAVATEAITSLIRELKRWAYLVRLGDHARRAIAPEDGQLALGFEDEAKVQTVAEWKFEVSNHILKLWAAAAMGVSAVLQHWIAPGAILVTCVGLCILSFGGASAFAARKKFGDRN